MTRPARSKKPLLAFAVILPVLLIGGAAIWRHQAASALPENQALDFARGVKAGQIPPNALIAGLESPEQRQCLAEILRPYFAGWSETGHETRAYRDTGHGFAYVNLRSTEGRQSAYGVAAFESPDGPKYVLSMILENAWSIEARAEDPRMPRLELELIYAQRLAQDRAKLEACGIEGIYSQGKLVKWDQLLRAYQDDL